MDPVFAGIVITAFLLIILAGGLWIGMALAAAGYVAMALFTSRPPGLLFGTTLWGANNSWALTALPLFIWMGEILFRTRLAEDMFKGLAPWVQRVPGRLLHTNVVGCAIFAAISGSSAATAATIGKMTIPELRRRGYSDFMIVGSLAGSGTLGLLIPPSIMMIVYGVAAQVSIGRLFIAGVVPGLFLMSIFSLIVAVYALLKPNRIPAREPIMPLMERIWESRRLIPILILVLAVLGCIYGGIATPTEAAAIGVTGALALALVGGGLDRHTFWTSVVSATRTSAMIGLILSGAAFLSTAMGFTGLPEQFADWIVSMQLPQPALIAALVCIFLVMGCFIDGISMILLTTSVLLPAVEGSGIDLLWFGIFVVLLVEIAQITPPVGFNLYVLQSLANRSIGYIALAALPFFAGLLALIMFITAVPDLVLWLPGQMLGQN
ncbi:TRAP transporter large permease [Sinorhizobium alkalisoli]|uniref:TRAP transporter large permease protein n=1 Tax=Sinorhizobium alkalisoli TaxID=1752398 RepID=A0A1E3VCE7_9HYPH|nr:TRAP transporter large permease subunit [Sinorhizobium alkalisoli]MCA1493801.1 TRAP transporter large permease subunit [Ensifer sp. NBAIM29]MCG5479655.1 TRAP transporter large permease subunit [Sinorhizobium alkalisoli]ODR91234.1 C4-dicarboxylate ABC transporter permease [Sinorhizobium alkalisoli]QFI66698.1 TRAP dicarboxylate transporter, DctM subunit, unknown substrate 5 [Sinorhizobium alkalisoli]